MTAANRLETEAMQETQQFPHFSQGLGLSPQEHLFQTPSINLLLS